MMLTQEGVQQELVDVTAQTINISDYKTLCSYILNREPLLCVTTHIQEQLDHSQDKEIAHLKNSLINQACMQQMQLDAEEENTDKQNQANDRNKLTSLTRELNDLEQELNGYDSPYQDHQRAKSHLEAQIAPLTTTLWEYEFELAYIRNYHANIHTHHETVIVHNRGHRFDNRFCNHPHFHNHFDRFQTVYRNPNHSLIYNAELRLVAQITALNVQISKINTQIYQQDQMLSEIQSKMQTCKSNIASVKNQKETVIPQQMQARSDRVQERYNRTSIRTNGSLDLAQLAPNVREQLNANITKISNEIVEKFKKLSEFIAQNSFSEFMSQMQQALENNGFANKFHYYERENISQMHTNVTEFMNMQHKEAMLIQRFNKIALSIRNNEHEYQEQMALLNEKRSNNTSLETKNHELQSQNQRNQTQKDINSKNLYFSLAWGISLLTIGVILVISGFILLAPVLDVIAIAGIVVAGVLGLASIICLGYAGILGVMNMGLNGQQNENNKLILDNNLRMQTDAQKAQTIEEQTIPQLTNAITSSKNELNALENELKTHQESMDRLWQKTLNLTAYSTSSLYSFYSSAPSVSPPNSPYAIAPPQPPAPPPYADHSNTYNSPRVF